MITANLLPVVAPERIKKSAFAPIPRTPPNLRSAESVAADPRIADLRARIICVEDPAFSADYHDPEKRSIANALTVRFKDGTVLDEVVVEYPIGHRRRRDEGIPLLEAKFRTNLARRFPVSQQQAILDASLDQARIEAMPVNAYVDLYVPQER